MTAPHDDRREPPRDEHLLAALRHAPDHGLTPPSHVTQAILAAAEQVHRAPAPAVAPPPPVRVPPVRRVTLAERLQALLAPRWAGSVAAGLVAALVVGLWYDEELPPPVSRERAAAPAANEARSPTPALPASARIEAPSAAPPSASPAAPPAAVQPARLPATRDDTGRVATASPNAEAAAKRAPEPTPQAAADAVPAPAAPTSTAQTPTVRKAAAPAAAAAATPPSPGPATAATASPLAADASRLAELAAAARSSAPSGGTGAGAPALESLRGSATASAQSSGAAAASPALTLLRRVRADAESRSAIWTWQTGATTSARSFDADAQAWLQALVYAARGRWVDVAERSDGGDATEVRWWRNDEAVALLRIEREGLRWIEPSGRVRHAPMTADELARLRPP